MKLYTRTGDDGSSGLFGGDRVSKSHLRLGAYGTLDELNSIVGLLRLHATPTCADPATLQRVQQDLFVLGAILATPAARQEQLGARMSKPTWDLADMEADIDRLTALAPPMTAFVLPGGTAASAYAHLARTVCRRAERKVVALTHEEPMNPIVVSYLNRLSDWLFALARAENATAGVADVQWVPKGEGL
jgi:cob(I)alamin adenosyltransferase